jgi:hypothetical protein
MACLPLVPFFEGRPLPFFPAFDGLLVALLRKALWLLQSVPQRIEQTTDVSWMVADPELPSDHYSYPLTCPYLSSKAVRLKAATVFREPELSSYANRARYS